METGPELSQAPGRATARTQVQGRAVLELGGKPMQMLGVGTDQLEGSEGQCGVWWVSRPWKYKVEV